MDSKTRSFYIILAISLMCIVVSGVILGSVNKMDTFQYSKDVQSISIFLLIASVVLFGLSFLVRWKGYDPNSTMIKLTELGIGIVFTFLGVLSHGLMNAAPESTQKRDIQNSIMPIIILGSVLLGKSGYSLFVGCKTDFDVKLQ